MARLARVKSILEVASAVALIVAAGVFVWSQFRTTSRPRPTSAVEEMRGEQLAAAHLTNLVGEADVALVEFGDFECPFCARYAATTHERVRQELIAEGLVRFAFLHFPLERTHRRAFKASEAAVCAGRQGAYWAMHDRMFAKPAALELADFRSHADALGLDGRRFEQCLNGEAKDKVAADLAEGRRLGVNGTPAFFLGTVADDGTVHLKKRINGLVPFDVLAREIDAIRAASETDQQAAVSNVGMVRPPR